MNNKIFIANGYGYLIWLRVSIVAFVIIYCENLNIVTMFYQNAVVYCWKMTMFVIILSRIFLWVDTVFSKYVLRNYHTK